MNEDNLIKYYNKFNEDKRLTRRHGIVEYTTSMKYIHKYLKNGELLLTNGLGHRKILGNAKVIERIVHFINSK